ncbi:recombination regulator RecX [Hartmannibacter diazotrophicus]|uniref:Regulatory protein RecX n=1 Tax=Hartmannibacter diazotrophicus TaxID=1482074 RepID=A0A2C9D6X0_9HYPH|nr:RecX family transcriptional regulator [Hartmannibacter diazotrophicus]SON55993.1 recombination regulator RecX [Hartmannibacter diazotrophicus]
MFDAPEQIAPLVGREKLIRMAMRHLDRYAASEAELRRVLTRCIDRHHRRQQPAGDDALGLSERLDAARDEALRLIDGVIDSCKRSGLIDDQRYCETRIVSSRRRGWSRHRIAGDLARRGLDRELVSTELRQADENSDDDAELMAAIRLVERRRLVRLEDRQSHDDAVDDSTAWEDDGPVETSRVSDRRRKQLGVLIRAGFSMGIAMKALEIVQERLESESGASESLLDAFG